MNKGGLNFLCGIALGTGSTMVGAGRYYGNTALVVVGVALCAFESVFFWGFLYGGSD